MGWRVMECELNILGTRLICEANFVSCCKPKKLHQKKEQEKKQRNPLPKECGGECEVKKANS